MGAGGFDDGKDDGALRTIGEVSKALGIKTHVLRYWEQQFPMLDPLKRSGGRRYYRPEDIRLVERIDALVNEQGYTLKGAKQVIEAQGRASVPQASGQTAESDPEPAPIPPPRLPLAVDAPPASDGGLADFFGRAAPEDAAGTSFSPEPGAAAPLPRAELVARLEAIHAALAEAVRA